MHTWHNNENKCNTMHTVAKSNAHATTSCVIRAGSNKSKTRQPKSVHANNANQTHTHDGQNQYLPEQAEIQQSYANAYCAHQDY